jgi:hypothetical protein
MASKVLLKLSGNIWLANSWKQQLEITDEGVQGEVIEGLRRTKMMLPYDRIAQVNLHRGVFAATLEIINKGGTGNLAVKGLNKDDGERAKKLIEEAILAAQTERRPANAGSSDSIAGELQKLADLRDKGILSENEFQTAKEKLLATQSQVGTHIDREVWRSCGTGNITGSLCPRRSAAGCSNCAMWASSTLACCGFS